MKWRSRIQVAVTNQRTVQPRHQTRQMSKKRGFVFALVLALLFLTGIAGAIRDTAVFYVNIARLYTQTPDSRLAMPLENVRKQQIADTWHAARGVNRVHEGQDIFATRGTPILSATSGYIYKIGQNNLGGQTVSVIGRGGRVYYYAHLDSYAPAIREGDWVTPRTVLGYVGTTGNAQGTPPHLHFGVYSGSGAINPLPLLRDRIPQTVRRNSTGTQPANRLINRKA